MSSVSDVDHALFAMVPDEVELLDSMFSFCEMRGFLARRFDIPGSRRRHYGHITSFAACAIAAYSASTIDCATAICAVV
jgi:hypothetical protein